MTAVALAVLAALCIGSGDFAGGVLGRRDPSPAALLAVFGVSVILVTPVAVLAHGAPAPDAIGWGLLMGVFWPMGVYALVLGVAQGRVVVVIPVSGVVAVSVPVIVDFLRGERPALLVAIGVAVGLVAVALVGLGHGGGGRSVAWSAAMGLIGGLATGAGYLALEAASEHGIWPISFASATAVTLTAIFLIARRQPLHIARGAILPALFMAVTFVVAFASILRGYEVGSLTVVTVVTSQYPVVTVLLAAIVWRQRPRGIQYAGISGSLAAVAMIAVGSL